MEEERLRVKQLEEQLSIEKSKLDQQALNKQQQLSQEVSKLQTLMQNENVAKEEKSKIFQARLDKFKDYPKINQFKTEALETSKLLSQQLDDLCQKIAQAETLCEIT